MRQTFQVETRPTITEFLLREQRRVPAATGAFTAVVNNVRLACKRIAHAVGQGALTGTGGTAGSQQRPGRDADAAGRAGRRDLRAHQRVERHARRPGVRGARGAHPHPGGVPARALPARVRPARRLVQHRRERLRGQHLLGAALPRRRDRAGARRTSCSPARGRWPRATRSTARPRCSCSRSAAARTASRSTATWASSSSRTPTCAIPAATREFAINASNERFWEPPVRRYVAECVQGKSGPRGADFNMRWIASMVAEVHRILVRGGLFMYPRDTKDPSKPGRLRLHVRGEPDGDDRRAGGRRRLHGPRAASSRWSPRRCTSACR